VFQAGTAVQNGKLVTSGGRVAAISAVADNLKDALAKAYEGVSFFKFDGMQYRKDIGHRYVQR